MPLPQIGNLVNVQAMSLKIGIVGLPNVGKSTLFTALTRQQVDAANYPFCTIEPNVGIVPVPDKRLDKLAEQSKSEKTLPATVEFVDIAGLVKGASQGEGLGNKFLANIREVDAIGQVVRVFEDNDIIHVHNEINPESDIEVINLELILSDQEALSKRIVTLEKQIKSGPDKKISAIIAVYKKLMDALDAGHMASSVELTDDEQELAKELNLLTTKPMLYIMNVGEDNLDYPKPSWTGNNPVVNICAKIESELADLDETETNELLATIGLSESGLNQLIREAYKTLGLITFFTTGPKESRAWTTKDGSLAPQAAGVIHTDFEKGFIRAEVIKWDTLLELGS